jgi:hypothetical protein
MKNPGRVLLLLSRIASSANLLSCNRAFKPEFITPDQEQTPNLYRLLGEPPVEVRVVRRGKKDAAQVGRLLFQ